MSPDVIVVGAGVSGLALARELVARGRAPVVLERARGVGGRCATRRVEGQPVDHGVAYLHGRSERLRSEIDALSLAPSVRGWPRVREGSGLPCQPEAFEADEIRLAPADGVSRLAKRLAQGLDVRLGSNVVALRPVPGTGVIGDWELALGSGERMNARAVVLTLPVPSAIALLRQLAPLPEAVAGILPVLGLVQTLPCLTVIARYPADVEPPAWEASFPAASRSIQAILLDSSKRTPPARPMLVIQAHARFSREHLDDPVERWTGELLAGAAALHGDWVRNPELIQSHVWRHARVSPPTQLAAPILLEFEGGASLGLSGDGLHPAGGIEGAFLSGLALAERLAPGPRA